RVRAPQHLGIRLPGQPDIRAVLRPPGDFLERLQPADALADDAERRGFIPCRHARRLLTYFQLGLAILLGGLDLERRHDVTSDAFRSSTARRPARTICA